MVIATTCNTDQNNVITNRCISEYSHLGCIIALNVLDLEILLDLWQEIPSPCKYPLKLSRLNMCEYISPTTLAGRGTIW
jgi:hypothetical protein